MDIFRFITAGNVDDGKSTLIGRLLYDTNNIKDDILQSIGDNTPEMNLAHITDGLRAERQQGITIDVAYKYFSTTNRKYIIVDAPGHFQYTKNLVTGASGVDAMIILIDAQNGITEQTRRHSLVASILKIKQVVIAVNKMDAIGYDEQVFTSIKNEYQQVAVKLQLLNLTFIPISALIGDNVSSPSQNMNWYCGVTLLQYLENCIPFEEKSDNTRFSIQCNIHSEIKGLLSGNAGKLISGKLRNDDIILVFPSKVICAVTKIIHRNIEVHEAFEGQNITVYFAKNEVLERGSIISDFKGKPICKNKFFGTICWLDDNKPLTEGNEYLLRINSSETKCRIIEVLYKIDNNTFDKYTDNRVEVNQFAKIEIGTYNFIAFDPYSKLRETGRGIIIDPETNNTAGAFVIEG